MAASLSIALRAASSMSCSDPNASAYAFIIMASLSFSGCHKWLFWVCCQALLSVHWHRESCMLTLGTDQAAYAAKLALVTG